MHPSFPAYVWGRDNAEVARLIRLAPAQLQIILKTRNEVQLLEKWLEHHLGIIEDGARIIVLDHMSTEKKIFELYERFAGRLILVRYEGYVDSAHSLAKFRELYAAVWAASEFYALLDTDEFLCLYDGFKLLWDRRILAYLQANQEAAFFPSLRLNNLLGRERAFAFSAGTARELHLSGKPVIRSALARTKLKAPVGHNCDLPVGLFHNTPLALVLLHLTTWPPERRIRVNMQKLANFGLLKDENDFQTLLGLKADNIVPDFVRDYIYETRLLADSAAARQAADLALGEDHIIFSPLGKAGFFPESLKEIFRRHVNAGRDFMAALDIDRQALGRPEQSLDAALKGAGGGCCP